MKPSRCRIALIAISAIVLPGVVAISLMPRSVEGVYNPSSLFSTMGCDCDQFDEMRDGRMLFHVMESAESTLQCYYKKDSSGSIVFTDREGATFMRAEPHLLGTRFYHHGSEKSYWRWKRFVTRKMRGHMEGTKIRDVVFESGGVRITFYDRQFNVLDTSFRPRKVTAPAVVPTP